MKDIVRLGLRQEDTIYCIQVDRANLRKVQARIRKLKFCETELLKAIAMMVEKHVQLSVKEISKN